MKDRISRKPGRVKITYDDGAVVEATITRADEPIEEVSLLNKANLLPDTVCSTLGIAKTSEPKDALIRLKNYADTVSASAGASSTEYCKQQISSVNTAMNTHVGNTLIHPRIAYGRCSSGETVLGFRPKVVFISGESTDGKGPHKLEYSNGHYCLNMALAIDGNPDSCAGYGAKASKDGEYAGRTSSVQISDTGFTVTSGYNITGLGNRQCSYFAFG